MEDELRLSLLVAGTCFIIAVLAHGIWKIRKNDKPQDKPRVEPRQWGDDIDDIDESSSSEDYDELGLGKVRVVKTSVDHDAVDSEKTADDETFVGDANEHNDPTEIEGTVENIEQEPVQLEEDPVVEPDEKKTKLYDSVVSNPKPHLQDPYDTSGNNNDASVFPEPPEFLLKEDADDESSQGDAPVIAQESPEPQVTNTSEQSQPIYKYEAEESPIEASVASESEVSNKAPKVASLPLDNTAEQVKPASKGKRNKSTPRKRKEPNFGNDQMRIDFDETEAGNSDGNSASASRDDSKTVEQEVLVLNVRTPEDSPISGAALLPMLLTLGFKFGDQNIFHRHVNANGKGPVLFSLANMFKPGVFDIDSMENFTTQGVSLFMILPIDGDPHQVFNMMHNAARKLADEFNAQVLDGRRSVLTKQGLQQYVEKIREFERRRIISRQ